MPAQRTGDHMDGLWRVFSDALDYADNGDEADRARFAESFNDAISRHSVGPRLATGLYWIRPWFFLTLDGRTVGFLRDRMDVEVPRGRPDAETYLALHDQLESRFIEWGLPVHSFPDLLAAAYAPANGASVVIEEIGDEGEEQEDGQPEPEIPYGRR